LTTTKTEKVANATVRVSATKTLFVITGAPGSGKTALVRELVALGFKGIDEPAREVLAQQRTVGGDGVPERDPRLFCDLMLSRAIADLERMRGAQTPVFFDRGIPDQIGYAELFGFDASMAQRAAAVHRYNDVVFALPSWPEIYVTDRERTMSFEAAEAFGERVREIYEHLDYTLVVVPHDTLRARARFVVETLSLGVEVR
jgi:predicted ATPase